MSVKNLFSLVRERLATRAVTLGLATGYYVGNFFGYIGILFFILGYVEHFQSGWLGARLISSVPFVSALLTIFGTVWTCIGVLAKPNPRAVSARTKNISIPIILIMCIATLVFWLQYERPNDIVLTGLTLIGLAAAVLRLLSQEEKW
jgi:hypothetical protein